MTKEVDEEEQEDGGGRRRDVEEEWGGQGKAQDCFTCISPQRRALH